MTTTRHAELLALHYSLPLAAARQLADCRCDALRALLRDCYTNFDEIDRKSPLGRRVAAALCGGAK